jgi:hypothetical protein
VQYGLYHYMLRQQLQTRDVAMMRPAVVRWLKVVLAWQVVVVGLSVVYVAVLAATHPPGYAWVAPAIGAVFGTALPLQFAVVAILRAGRPS